ncbi:MAG: prepilin-type N-terminal cleavage/methylation domain-containing protein [Gammaproteobacteria bacterium]|nr:prepilin-type N-terminal cleavage/methylation domain-containing protein [Gammaproteobacteria bacterium]MDH5800255.1 prepilin-type N-terminal cleavage/methylation domain-containing protein [Gammaproteobacteria bacterium]
MAGYRGFTLVEMVMVMLIIGVLAGVTAPIFSQGVVAARLTSGNLQTLEKLRYTLERLARELRHVNYNGSAYEMSVMNSTALTFTKSDDALTTVSVWQNAQELYLSYSNPAVSAVLCDEISLFSLAYYDNNNVATLNPTDVAYVELTLSLQSSLTTEVFSQRTRISLRDRS